jgi:hypothetical protein
MEILRRCGTGKISTYLKKSSRIQSLRDELSVLGEEFLPAGRKVAGPVKPGRQCGGLFA